MSSSASKPVKVFKARGVSASVFANTITANGGEFVMHKVNLQRTFKDGDEFKRVSNFGRDEIPVACLLLQKAYEFILESEAAARKTPGEE